MIKINVEHSITDRLNWQNLQQVTGRHTNRVIKHGTPRTAVDQTTNQVHQHWPPAKVQLHCNRQPWLPHMRTVNRLQLSTATVLPAAAG
jgi:hypothetical protein